MKRNTKLGAIALITVIVAASILAANLNAGDYPSSKKTSSSQEGTWQYLIQVPHTTESCLKALDETKAMGLEKLNQYNWGCMVGDHTAYVIVDAKSEADALNTWVSPSERSDAKVIKLNKFTAEQIASFHKK